MRILLKSFLLSLIFCSVAEAKIFSPVVALNTTKVTADDAAYTKAMGATGFATGVVVYEDTKYENLYFRFGAMLERRKFFFNNAGLRKKFDHMTVGAQAGVAYRFAEIFWPFLGLSSGWSGKDECTYQESECGENKFAPLWAGSQMGIAMGAAENFKVEIVIENQLLEVDSRFDKYRTVSILIHFFPDEN